VVKEISQSVGEVDPETNRTTNNRPLEVIVAIGNKIRFALEMFIVDLMTLRDPSTSTRDVTDVLQLAETQLGLLNTRIEQFARDARLGILRVKRKAEGAADPR
jgi:uncharacterized membrane protein